MPRSGTQNAGDDWSPPAWAEQDRLPAVDVSDSVGAQANLERSRASLTSSGTSLGIALAPAATGLLAFAFAGVGRISGAGSVPKGLLLLLLIQILALAYTRASDAPALSASWISVLFVTNALLPLLALQVTMLREPYVSLARNSAGPAIFATCIVMLVILLAAFWCVFSHWQTPDRGPLYFMPVALLVPVIVGMRTTVHQKSALLALAAVMLLAAVASAIAWVTPYVARPFVPAAALAIEFAGLWISGHGPWFHETSGGIVRLLYTGLLIEVVLLALAVPLFAMRATQFMSRRPKVNSRYRARTLSSDRR